MTDTYPKIIELPGIRATHIPQRIAKKASVSRGWAMRVLEEYLGETHVPDTGLPPFGRRLSMWRTHFQHLAQEALLTTHPEAFLASALHGWHDGFSDQSPDWDDLRVIGRLYGSLWFDNYRFGTRLIPPYPRGWRHDEATCLTCPEETSHLTYNPIHNLLGR